MKGQLDTSVNNFEVVGNALPLSPLLSSNKRRSKTFSTSAIQLGHFIDEYCHHSNGIDKELCKKDPVSV